MKARTDSWSIDKIQCSEWGHPGCVADVWASTLNHDEISFSMSLHPDGFSVVYNFDVDFFSDDLHPYEAQDIVENQILDQAELILQFWWNELTEARNFAKSKQAQITRGVSAEDSFYAAVAYLYRLRAQMQPLFVTQLLSGDMSVPITTVKERIRKARERKMLTSPGKGMNGQSEITKKALKLLRIEGLIK